MLFLASAITLAVFTSIGYSNPNQAWAQALKDDRGTSAPSAAEPASEASPAILRRRVARGRHPKRCQRLRNDSCPRECPNGSRHRLTSWFVSRCPRLFHVRAPFHGKPYGGRGIRAGLSAGNALERVEPLAASRYAGLVWMATVASRVGGNRPVDYSR